jgi:decaprenylphospho-beta-D-ribofuranose 2-oxidase
MNAQPASDVPVSRIALTGWGRTAATVARYAEPAHSGQLAGLLDRAGGRGVIPRGLGRSYNNAAQNGGGLVIGTARLNRILAADPRTGLVTAEAGLSLEQLLTAMLPSGWFVPVTPGTRQVSLGGAIAADVHGKNHHAAGSFARHVRSFDLLMAGGQVRTVTPEDSPELFWATAGGMGLTGIILRATVQMTPVQTSRVRVDTFRAASIDEAMERLSETDARYRYTVAWSDCLARGAALGRSVITCGDFAAVDELPRRQRRQPFAFRPGARFGAPPWFPDGLLNAATVAAANEAWYRKAPRQRAGEIQTIGQFFHPLDAIRNWNRAYGRAGFVQYQYVVPFGHEDVIRATFERTSAARAPSFVTVLKRFGESSPGPLSFPAPGWTLALDFPARTPGLAALLDWLDEQVLAAGGRVYLAKDGRVRPLVFEAMYPRAGEFRGLRAGIDPHRRFASDLSRRLAL